MTFKKSCINGLRRTLCSVVFSGGTTVYIHGTGFNNVTIARLVVKMKHNRLNGTGQAVMNSMDFNSDVSKQ